MRTSIFFYIVFLLSCFSLTVSGQYTWKQKGLKNLVDKERKYFGTETRPEELKKLACGCDPHADYSNQGIKFLGNLSPDMGETGKGLFWNFDKQGRAHLTELEGKDQVFVKGNCVYAYACGNLLKQEELETKSPAPEKKVVINNNHQPEKVAVEKSYQNFEKNPYQGENMVYVIEAYKFYPNTRHRGAGGLTGAFLKVTQSEAIRLVDRGISPPDWQGKGFYWRYFNDADYYRLGITKPNYNHLR